MIITAIALTLGTLAFYLIPSDPAWPWLAGGACVILLSLCLTQRIQSNLAVGLLALLLGYIWPWGLEAGRADTGLRPTFDGQITLITGRIADLPQREVYGQRTILAVIQAPPQTGLGQGDQVLLRNRVASVRVQAGESWRLRVRLRQPRPARNPGGFDEAAWLYRQHIVGVAEVQPTVAHSSDHNQRLSGGSGLSLLTLRAQLANRLHALLGDGIAAGLLGALTIGDTGGLDKSDWRVFSATGTTHLITISGLHVGLVAALVGTLTFVIWARLPGFALRWPAPQAAAAAGFIAAVCYAALAGLSVPTLRSLIMLALVLIAIILQRQAAGARVLALTLIGVVLTSPRTVLAPGTWLSFVAVAMLLYSLSSRLRPAHPVRQLLQLQWMMTVALVPLILFWFQQFSLSALLVNLVTIPLFTFIIVPLGLLGIVLLILPWQAPATWCLKLAALLIDLIWPAWHWFAEQPWATWTPPMPPWWALPIASLGLLWYFAPHGWPRRWLGLVIAVCVLLLPKPTPPWDEARIFVLDVGAGTAVLVQTQRHALLYGTGPRGRSGDAGASVIVPALRWLHVAHLDAVVLAREQAGYTGGYRSLAAFYRPDRLWMGGDAIARLPEAQACQAAAWQWEGVRLRLAPAGAESQACVLYVGSGEVQVVLGGEKEHRPMVPDAGFEQAGNTSLICQTALLLGGFNKAADDTLAGLGDQALQACARLRGAGLIRLDPHKLEVESWSQARWRYW